MSRRAPAHAPAALRRLDPDAIADEAARLVRIPSVTGDERGALEHLAARAEALGLRATVVEHDLEAVRAAIKKAGIEPEESEV
ncbi:MAG TPA: hypothetical protein VLB47_07775, partial [Solirubrobacteraceae bacterium]|nr:hypothetical protein [Solirubrobacteraceae bacterium]